MSDAFDKLPAQDAFDALPEGGAEGGGADNAPSKPLIKAAPVDIPNPLAEADKKIHMGVALSGGQSLAGLPPEELSGYKDRGNAQTLGAFIAAAKGVPFTGEHIDELSGLLQAHAASGPEYEKKRDEARKAVGQAVKEHPMAPAVGSLALAPFAPESAGGRIALGTAEGLSAGVGAAPEMKDVPKAAGVGTLTGLGTSLAGEGLIQGGKYLAGKRGDVLAQTRAATDAAQFDDPINSSMGSFRQKTGVASNHLSKAEASAADMRLPESERAAWAAYLDSPEGLALREQLSRNNRILGPAAMSDMQEARQAWEDLRAGATQDARAAAAQARVDDPSALLRRVRELGPKVVLPAIGAGVGGPLGAMAGAGTAAVLGRSGTTVRNAIADPYVASRLLGAGSGVLNAAGRGIQSEAPAAASGLLDNYFDDNETRWSSLKGKP